MDIENWKNILRKCRTTQELTGNRKGVFVRKSSQRTVYQTIKDVKCSCCGAESRNVVTIVFKEPQSRLSIFQAELLYMMFAEGKKPTDYADYHKCPAGKKFIGNIKYINFDRF